MKINANDIRVGNVIEHNKKLMVVTKTEHVQPGKGGAYMQVEMKGLLEPTKLHERFRSAETVEKIYLENLPYQFLYQEGDNFVFMDETTYEQISLHNDFVGDAKVYLQDGMVIELSMYEGKPLSVNLPETVVLEIKEADAVVKGQTASSSYKPAILENGLRIMVPPHIGTGTKVVVRTSDNAYMERAK